MALIDLALTLKHVHWNVVGPNFIRVHEMLDPVSEDLLTGRLRDLEPFQWLVRVHLESASGEPATGNARTEKEAAAAARR